MIIIITMDGREFTLVYYTEIKILFQCFSFVYDSWMYALSRQSIYKIEGLHQDSFRISSFVALILINQDKLFGDSSGNGFVVESSSKSVLFNSGISNVHEQIFVVRKLDFYFCWTSKKKQNKNKGVFYHRS